MIIFFLVTAAAILADVATKYLAYTNLRGGNDIEIIKNVLYLSYVENPGAAFGMLKNARWLFISITVIVVAFIVIYVIVKKPESRLMRFSLSLIVAGGIGNLIDRISLSYVIDFIDFRIIDFPVFNVADICVTIGAALLILYIMFFEGKQSENNKI